MRRNFRIPPYLPEATGSPAACWRAEHDKIDHDHKTPITRQAREALDAHLRRFPGTGEAWLFPHPEKDGEPITRHYPNKWLEDAEDRAGLEPLEGKLWHAYRAKFATDLLDAGVSPVHVARLGGWKRVETVLEIYGQPSEEMLQDALERRHGPKDTSTCEACGTEGDGNYCAECGEPLDAATARDTKAAA